MNGGDPNINSMGGQHFAAGVSEELGGILAEFPLGIMDEDDDAMMEALEVIFDPQQARDVPSTRTRNNSSKNQDVNVINGNCTSNGNGNTTITEEESSVGLLEDYHVVLKSKLTGPTAATTIFKQKTRKIFGKKKHATDQELEDVRENQNLNYRNEFGGNLGSCSVSFWVELDEENASKGWIVEESKHNVRRARTGKTEIPYVLATDECMRCDIKNNFGRSSLDRPGKKQRPPPIQSAEQDGDTTPETNFTHQLQIVKALLKSKLSSLENGASVHALAPSDQAQAKAKVDKYKIERVQLLINEIEQQIEMSSNNADMWRSCQKRSFYISKTCHTGIPTNPPDRVEIIICHGSLVNFSPKNDSIGIRAAGLVCASNESCEPMCGGATQAVTEAGGSQLLTDACSLPILVEIPDGPKVRCFTGHAVAVHASPPSTYGTLSVGHVIYAVGPSYGETFNVIEEKALEADLQLGQAYVEALDLAEKAQLEAVAFSLMSAGKRSNSWDRQRAIRIAVDTIYEYQDQFQHLKEVHLCAFMEHELTELQSIANARWGAATSD